MHVSSVMIRGRREVRRKLGLPVDATDEIAPLAPPQRQPVVVEDVQDPRDIAVAIGHEPRHE